MEKKKTPKKKRKETKQEEEEEKKAAEEMEEEKAEEELKEITEKEIKAEEPAISIPEGWIPRTTLGQAVAKGKITDIDDIFEKGRKITESQIVDVLIPNLQNEIVMIGGTGGKGGGARRIVSRRTTRMHKSGRRFRTSAMMIVGNNNGYVGVGMGSGPTGKHREIIEKATNKAKLNLIPIRRGCGSWECKCGGSHSIPFTVKGKCGSVHVELYPAPKGIGLCVSDEVKKVMKLAGVKDIWCKSRGQTTTRYNTIRAVMDALSKLNRFRTREDYEKTTGMKTGRVD